MAWSDLPTDLLICIAYKLPLVEFIRFSVVCTSWNFVLANNDLLRIRGPTSPWLLLPNDAGEDSDTLTFRDLTIKGNVPCHRCLSSLSSHIFGRRCFGSKDGWLVTLDKTDLQPRLFNPLTKVEISFPSLFTIPEDEWHRIKPHYAPDGSIQSYFDEILPDFASPVESFREVYIHKIVLSTNNPFGTAVVIYGYYRLLALARPNDQTWVLGPQLRPYLGDNLSEFEDVYYHEEERMFYAITRSSAVLAFDLNGQNVKLICPPQDTNGPYRKIYITFLSGTLLKIERGILDIDIAHETFTWKTIIISVFKLVPTIAKVSSFSEWIVVKNLGGSSFFIGCNNTFSLHHTVAPEIKPNCIYFSDDSDNMSSSHAGRDAGLFDMENNCFQYFFNFDSQCNWPPSIWFTPSLF